MTIVTKTIRPGFLVSLKTTLSGNVKYSKIDIEADHLTKDGKKKAKWETERTVTDPVEHEEGVRVRGKVRRLITSVCTDGAFGLLCPQDKAEQLEVAVKEAREQADAFNTSASLSDLKVYIIVGKIAADDVEALRAINSEVRDLMSEMEQGLKDMDVKAIREAASKAAGVGAMLSADYEARVKLAVEAARKTAREIQKADDPSKVSVDKWAISKIKEARTAFLDLDDAAEVAAPKQASRTLDMAE